MSIQRKLLILFLSIAFGVQCYYIGRSSQRRIDQATIIQAQQNEMQANGLEDECKAVLKTR